MVSISLENSIILMVVGIIMIIIGRAVAIHGAVNQALVIIGAVLFIIGIIFLVIVLLGPAFLVAPLALL